MVNDDLTELDVREEHDSARTETRDPQPTVVWVATEFSIDDGGRAWIQAASSCETAKRLCVEHLNRNGDPVKPRALTWSDDRGAKWLFGQDTEAAHVDGHEYYEVRRVEVEG